MVHSWVFMLLCLQKFQTIQLLKNVGNSRKRRIPNNRCDCRGFPLVPRAGLEPAHLAAHAPETCASTNSATWACGFAQFVLRLAVQR